MKIQLSFARAACVALFFALATLGHAREASEIEPLLIGAAAPEVSVQDETGKEISLRSITKGKNTVLVFYRGGWCPFCSTHLQGLAEAQEQLTKLGYQIVAISPDSPENLKTAEKKGDLGYALYSDPSLAAADAFGISFTLDAKTLKAYKGYGIDLAKTSGGANPDRLPVPAVFLVGKDNSIRFAYVNPDYETRISSELLLAAAKQSKK